MSIIKKTSFDSCPAIDEKILELGIFKLSNCIINWFYKIKIGKLSWISFIIIIDKYTFFHIY